MSTMCKCRIKSLFYSHWKYSVGIHDESKDEEERNEKVTQSWREAAFCKG
jgi:hypothetical protein